MGVSKGLQNQILNKKRMNKTEFYLLNVTESFEEFNFINNYYVITVICIVSSLFCLALILILLSIKANEKMLYLFKWKCLNDMLICILGSTIGNSMCNYCIDFSRNTLFAHIYRIFFLRYLSEILTGVSVMLEIFITYDRLCLIKGNQAVFANLKASYLYWSFFLINLVAYLPDVFVNQLEPLADGFYLRTSTLFGKSIYYNYYYLSLVTLLSFLTILIVTILNWQTYVVYKQFMANKVKISCVGPKQDTDSTKMIIVLNILFVFPRILFLIGTILPRIDNLNHIPYNPLTNTYRLVDYDLLLAVFGLNCLVIMYYNKKVKTRIVVILNRFCLKLRKSKNNSSSVVVTLN